MRREGAPDSGMIAAGGKKKLFESNVKEVAANDSGMIAATEKDLPLNEW